MAMEKVMSTDRRRQARRGTVQLSYDDAQQAKAKVLEHWIYLDALSKRRFPKSENLAHEGLLYVLENLEANGWKHRGVRLAITHHAQGYPLPIV